MRKKKNIFTAYSATALLGLSAGILAVCLAHTHIATFVANSEQLAAVFFKPGSSVADLQRKYDRAIKTKKTVRILLVPGHEPFYGGAEYRNLKERELALELSEHLAKLLETNRRYDVSVSRNRTGWDPVLLNYFANNWESIGAFAQKQKVETAKHIGTGALVKHDPAMIHNTAPSDVGLRLYGIHKWANENDIDLSIHIHFNDHPRKNGAGPGKYTGFTLYIPDPQYSNGKTARAVAERIFARLSQTYSPSDMPKEAPGIVESQDLIAVGSYNTSDAPSILIEYAYIYEAQLQDEATRSLMLQDMALQTYEGLQDFFENRNKHLVQKTR